MSEEVKPILFTEAELNYLLGKSDPNGNYSRVLKHRILRKLNEFETLIWPILKTNPLTQRWVEEFLSRAFHARDPGSNPGDRTNTSAEWLEFLRFTSC